MSVNEYFGVELRENALVVRILKPISDFSEEGAIDELDDVISQLKQSPDARHLVVDMNQHDYIASTMLEALRRIWGEVRRKEGTMALANLSKFVREILKTSRFDTVWTICDTLDEALQKG